MLENSLLGMISQCKSLQLIILLVKFKGKLDGKQLSQSLQQRVKKFGSTREIQ